jgi:hypothetical protein
VICGNWQRHSILVGRSTTAPNGGTVPEPKRAVSKSAARKPAGRPGSSRSKADELRNALSPGDTIEFAITLSHDYNSVKSGCTTKIRPGETATDAQERAEGFSVHYATQAMKDLS